MAYGVQPAGFVLKRLPEILAEIEESAREVFGPGVIQTAQSPLGQLNGLMASIVATAWEIGESTYQSYDPDQAEGVRLDQLGRIRLLDRMTGEAETEYRAAITNAGRARIDLADIARAAAAVDGVSFVRVYENRTGATNAIGLTSHSIGVAALGGDDAAVASAIRPYIVPGIDAWGNARVDVEIDGYCRSISIIRPVPVPLGLQVRIQVGADRLGCPPPAAAAVALAIISALTGAERPANGQDISLHFLRTVVSSQFPNVEVVSAMAALLPDGPLQPLPVVIRFLEIAEVVPVNVTVTTL